MLRRTLALAAVVASATAYKNEPVAAAGGWVDLFTPPFFQDCPVSMLMNIDCQSKTSCFFNGGTSNSPMSVYRSYDEDFRNTSRLEVDKDLLLLGLAMEDSTHGVTGGLGILVGGTYYTTDGQTFHASSGEIGMMQTQAMYSLGSGSYALINAGGAEGPNGGGVGISTDGGKTYKGYKTFANLKTPTGAMARYGAFPSKDVWYVSGGCWPPSNNTQGGNVDQYHYTTARIRTHVQTGKTEFVTPFGQGPNLDMIENDPLAQVLAHGNKVGQSDVNGSYTAVIAKTSDGGATWELQYSSTGEFYFNQIDCASEDVCMAVGEGFAHDGSSNPGAFVFTTTDGGKTWTQAYQMPNAGGMTVKMLSATEAWVGAYDGSGVAMLHTTDGGKTFEASPSLRGTAAIMSMSFIGTDTAYAAAITRAQDSTVIAYGIPAPKPGPGPGPGPSGGAFTQKQCSDANCSTSCQSHQFPQGQCLKTTSGGSAKVLCNKAGTELITQEYTSTDCSGTFKNQTEPTDKCLKSTTGNYFENECTSASFAIFGSRSAKLELE